jgi:vacuolar-type H+-ATPase subunit H
LVIQASKNTATGTGSATEFRDLELVKQTEMKSISDIENAKKQAELIVSKAEQDISANEKKAISDLKAMLDADFKTQENKAKSEANKIISDGESEAEKLKQEIRGRIPQAVEHIMKSIIEK